MSSKLEKKIIHHNKKVLRRLVNSMIASFMLTFVFSFYYNLQKASIDNTNLLANRNEHKNSETHEKVVDRPFEEELPQRKSHLENIFNLFNFDFLILTLITTTKTLFVVFIKSLPELFIYKYLAYKTKVGGKKLPLDLKHPGILTLLFDILYINCLIKFLSVFSGKFYFLYLIMVVCFIFEIKKMFSFLKR